jgi:hypothetical protein
VSSHALLHGPEARNRRRTRHRENLRRLRDWRTWGVLLAVILAFPLSGWMTGRFWPDAHGAGYFVTHIVVRALLTGAIGAVLVAVLVTLAGIGRDRRLQP